jgi:hypothetical protein
MEINLKVLIPIVIIWTFLVIFALVEYYERCYLCTQLKGFWKAPMAFCTKSGIGSFMLNFTEDTVYLLMIATDNSVILNKCVNYEKEACNTLYLASRDQDGTYSFELEFDDPVLPLPEEVVMKFNPSKGMLYFIDEDNEQILLEAYKACSESAGVI